MRSIYAVVRKLLPQRTVERVFLVSVRVSLLSSTPQIIVMRKEYQQQFREWFDESNLLLEHGGTCELVYEVDSLCARLVVVPLSLSTV